MERSDYWINCFVSDTLEGPLNELAPKLRHNCFEVSDMPKFLGRTLQEKDLFEGGGRRGRGGGSPLPPKTSVYGRT